LPRKEALKNAPNQKVSLMKGRSDAKLKEKKQRGDEEKEIGAKSRWDVELGMGTW